MLKPFSCMCFTILQKPFYTPPISSLFCFLYLIIIYTLGTMCYLQHYKIFSFSELLVIFLLLFLCALELIVTMLNMNVKCSEA